MNINLKKIISIWLITSLLSAGILTTFAADESIGWYCVRAKNHKQPLADSNMRYIEKYNGYYIDKAHDDNCDDKVVYLTFDAGYENGNVKKILDTMKSENVTGAFFILGNVIDKNPELVKQMIEDGHIVGNHTNKHKDMTRCQTIEEFESELKTLEDAYTELTGKQMSKYYRPPEGKFNEKSMKFANDLGYKTIFWSFAYADWDNSHQMSEDSALEKILSNMHNGAVILLHPTSATNAAIMGTLIKKLKDDGYRFGTLDELCIEKNEALEVTECPAE